jgi:hypothetical protein
VTPYSIACLAGDGIGPEVMAQASRGLRAAARMHGLELEEEHVPFGADATMRFGQPFLPLRGTPRSPRTPFSPRPSTQRSRTRSKAS